MVVVLLLPVVLLLVACLLDRFERRMISSPPGPRTRVARPAPADPPDGPVAAVVPLRRGPELDAATLRLRRVS